MKASERHTDVKEVSRHLTGDRVISTTVVMSDAFVSIVAHEGRLEPEGKKIMIRDNSRSTVVAKALSCPEKCSTGRCLVEINKAGDYEDGEKQVDARRYGTEDERNQLP